MDDSQNENNLLIEQNNYMQHRKKLNFVSGGQFEDANYQKLIKTTHFKKKNYAFVEKPSFC